jgi:hypothetical protein
MKHNLLYKKDEKKTAAKTGQINVQSHFLWQQYS